MELGLAGRTALVTGGSKGIGLETARALAREGVKVLICARRPDALADAARDIMQTTQQRIETHPLDVTRLDEIETILKGVWDNLGRLGAEFAHLDHVWEHDPAFPEKSRIEIGPRTHELFAKLRLSEKPALIFAAHLGNW